MDNHDQGWWCWWILWNRRKSGGSGGGGGGNGGGYSNVHATAEIQSIQNTPFVPQTGFNQYGNNGGAPSDSNPGNGGGGGGSGLVGGSHPGVAEGGPAWCVGGNGQPFPGFLISILYKRHIPSLPNATVEVVGDNGYYGGGGGGQRPYGSNPTTLGGLGGGGGFRGGNFIKDGVANTGGENDGGVSSGGNVGNGEPGICIISGIFGIIQSWINLFLEKKITLW